MTSEKSSNTFVRILKKTGRILLRTVAIIILLLVAILILIQTPPAQNFIVKKATAYLEKKLQTRVQIGRLYVGFPKNIVIENIYLEDRKKDTLLAGGRLKADISMMKLLDNEVEVNDLRLDQITAKVKRVLPDTTFNFQFIVDAFASGPKDTTKKADTSALKIAIKYVQLDRIRLVYNDVITGNDVDVWLQHFDTKIDRFDLNTQRFDVPIAKLQGLRARVYQTKPFVEQKTEAQHVAEAAEPSTMQLNLKRLLLDDINLDYKNDVSALYSTLALGKLEVNVNKLDLVNRVIDLDNIQLDKTIAAIRLGKKEEAKVVKEEVNQKVEAQAETNWRVTVKKVRLNENNLQFDDGNKPKLGKGIDYAHLNATGLTFHIDNLLYSKDSIAGSITEARMKEQSGLQLNRLETDFLYAANQAYFKNLILQTPGTEIQRSVVLQYPSIETLKNNLGALRLDVDLYNSKIQVKDILTFVPTLSSQPALANPGNTIYLTGKLTGSIARLGIQTLQIRALQDTRVNVNGTVIGLPDMKKAGGNLTITELSTSRRDIVLLAPKGSLPSSITIPERIKITGKIAGGMNNVSPNLLISTSLGSASVRGSIKQPTDKKRSQYDLVLETNRLDLGTLLKQKQNVGLLSARFTAKGRGYDPKTANATINGVVRSAMVKNYNYRDFKLIASIANQHLDAKASIHDPNIDFTLDASGNMSDKYPAIVLNATIDSIKTLPLHLTTDSILYRGVITANFPVTDPDNLNGDLLITKSLLVKNSDRLELDTIQLSAGKNDSGQFVRLSADAVNVALQGKYRLTQLASVFQQAIEPYFALAANSKAVKVDPYDFSFTGSIVNKPILQTFLPALTRLDPVALNGRFSSTAGWNMSVNSPYVIFGESRVENMQLQAGTSDSAIGIKANIQQLTSGKSIALYGTSLTASIANNSIDFLFNIKDKVAKDKYRFGATFTQPQPGDYAFSLKPQNLLLNYDLWAVPGDNLISILKTDIKARNFILTKSDQKLSINSQSQETTNSPMDVQFDNFKIATLANFVVTDTLPVDGTLNGQVVLSNLTTLPTFTTDLTISDVSVKADTIGTVNVKVNNTVANTFAADVNISGHGNDVQLAGNYYVRPDSNSSFDMTLDIRQILLKTLEGASMGAISDASGKLTGKFAVNGTVTKPSVNGNIDFKAAAFNLGMLNSYFRIDDERIEVNDQGVRFNTFTIKDSANNSAILDGMVYYNPGFTDYRFDLSLKADNFRALNTAAGQNKVYYGQVFFNSNLRVKGTQVSPVVDGSITINEKTKLTIVLPQKEPGLQAREGIVEFVDMDAIPNDSLFMAKYDSINKSDVLGMDIAVNINVDKLAEFNVIVDEANGDFLNVRGEAALSGGIDPSGKINLTGSYNLEEGAYELSFNVLHRRFNIQKGSTIVWTGEPTKANVDITAVYIAKTAPLDLIQDQLAGSEASEINYYRQKLPFEVDLKMKGELLKPTLTFDIVLPTDQNYNIDKSKIINIENKLALIRQEPSEINKQVFALLLLGRFISENPFASSSSGFSAEGFARSSVSQLMSEQLNNLASDLVKGVDINFDVESTDDDYTTGEKKSRTDLNVALSKRLLNDRLTVTVGSNFELEGAQPTSGARQKTNNLAGNVSLDYKLSKDGRYSLRAYRKNEYEGVVEGNITETGVGFVITVDYNKFSQIFLSQKQREQKRQIRRQEREENKDEKNKAAADRTKAEADDRKNDVKTTQETSNG